VKDYSVLAIQKKCRKINDLPAAIKSDMPSLARINKQFGEDFIQAYIEGWIVNLREFFNIGKNMTDEQTQETAMLIVTQFYNLTLADINLIFKMAKLGQLGKVYDRLDGQIILSWFDSYYNKRCEIFASNSIQESSKYKNVLDDFDRNSKPMKMSDIIKKPKTMI